MPVMRTKHGASRYGAGLNTKYPAGEVKVRRRVAWAVCLVLSWTAWANVAAEKPVLQIPRVSRPPRLEDFEGMRPSPDLPPLARVTEFLQRNPSDGAPVSERTEAYLGYDEAYLYAVFLCFDREPAKVRARLVNREQILQDDYVTLQLDTFRDMRRAYVFGANGFGVQADAIWNESQGFDLSFDTVYQARGKLTDQGYMVWMRVPFKSLRFPAAAQQTWGILLTRDIPRRSEESFWPQYTARIEGRLNQIATLSGLEQISPGRTLQLQPYGVLRSSRSLDARDPSVPRWETHRVQADGGLDSKLVLKDSLVLDLTVNPDFSQVESDEPQVTANQRYELFYPEKRPYFLENASYYDTPIPLLFTRRIADPQFGVRLTGKVGPYGIGALVVDDESPGKRVPETDPDSGRRAYFGVLRVNRDVYRQSSIGLIFTDREFGSGHNRVGGVDGRFKLPRNWVASFQAVASSTAEPGAAAYSGAAYDIALKRSSRALTLDFAYQGRSRGFRSEVGFIPRTDIRHLGHTSQYKFWNEGRTLQSWGPKLVADITWDHGGELLEWLANPGMEWSLSRQTRVLLTPTLGAYRVRPEEYPVLAQPAYYQVRDLTIDFETNVLPQVSASARVYFLGSGVNFFPAAGQPPTLEAQQGGRFVVTLRPLRRLTVQNTYHLRRLARRSDGRNIFNNHILHSRWNYQFTTRFSARAIVQYESVLPNPALTSLTNRKNVNADFLLTYLVHPGTAVFVGYNSNLQNLDRSLTPLPGGFLRTRRSFLNDGRQVFVKVSYLLRF